MRRLREAVLALDDVLTAAALQNQAGEARLTSSSRDTIVKVYDQLIRLPEFQDYEAVGVRQRLQRLRDSAAASDDQRLVHALDAFDSRTEAGR